MIFAELVSRCESSATHLPSTTDGTHQHQHVKSNAAGHVRIELQDASGKPIQGYALEDSDQIIGDEIERIVSWQGRADVSPLVGRSIRMRLELKDADVYAFQYR